MSRPLVCCCGLCRYSVPSTAALSCPVPPPRWPMPFPPPLVLINPQLHQRTRILRVQSIRQSIYPYPCTPSGGWSRIIKKKGPSPPSCKLIIPHRAFLGSFLLSPCPHVRILSVSASLSAPLPVKTTARLSNWRHPNFFFSRFPYLPSHSARQRQFVDAVTIPLLFTSHLPIPCHLASHLGPARPSQSSVCHLES